MKKMFAALALICLMSGSANADWGPKCEFNPSESLKRAVVGIDRTFDPDEIYIKNFEKIYGGIATGWFTGQRTIATIEHVATGMKLTKEWKVVSLFWSDTKDTKATNSVERRVRVHSITPTGIPEEGIAVLEIDERIDGILVPKIAGRPPQRDEAAVGITYKKSELRFGDGRFAPPKPSGEPDPDAKPPLPFLLFEIFDPNRDQPAGDRYVFDQGSSGSPIFNCDGEVIAMAAKTTTHVFMQFAGKTIYTSSSWGNANVYSVSPVVLLNKKR